MTYDDAEAWAAVLTRRFQRPGAKGMLKPWQGYALFEALEALEGMGAFLALPVGTGKTLLTYLLPAAREARRPLLFVPASLVDKTYHEFAQLRRDGWRSSEQSPTLLSRAWLSRAENADALERYRPDLIVLDEGDDWSNPMSAAVRRLWRYKLAHPEVPVYILTATPARKSLLNFWHLLVLALGPDAPVPLRQAEATLWASVVDLEAPRAKPGAMRALPGALGATAEAARAWLARRLRETRGVLIVDGDSCSAPLTIRLRYARESTDLDAAFERLRVEGETPSGIPVDDPLSQWALAGQLGCGLYRYWHPEPPEPWREARRAEARFVRMRIADTTHALEPLDTESQVLSRHADHPIVRDWLAVRDTFDERKHTRVAWYSRATLDDVHAWLAERELESEPGIVWCGSIAFAKRLAEESGLRFYHRGGRAADGAGLFEADATESLIASWQANKKGFNLQAWRHQLIVLPPQSAKWLEQVFGRSHRQGQLRGVIIDILVTSGDTVDAFDAAIAEARWGRGAYSMTQKILRASIERGEPPARSKSNAYRWATKRKECNNATTKQRTPASPARSRRPPREPSGAPAASASLRRASSGARRVTMGQREGIDAASAATGRGNVHI